jgi:hypothetical protein
MEKLDKEIFKIVRRDFLIKHVIEFKIYSKKGQCILSKNIPVPDLDLNNIFRMLKNIKITEILIKTARLAILTPDIRL